MIADKWQSSQTSARQIRSIGDVQAVMGCQTPVYNACVLPWLPVNRQALIYEAACGPGLFLLYLRQMGYTEARGSDTDEVAILLAQKLDLAVECKNSLMAMASMMDSSVDVVVAIDFIEHLERDMFLSFITQSSRVLKPGGCLILRAPNGDSPMVGRNLFNDITHQWAYTSISLNAMLLLSGFDDVKFKDDSIAAIVRWRWIKVPLMKLAQSIMRGLIRAATRENVRYLSPSLFVCARRSTGAK